MFLVNLYIFFLLFNCIGHIWWPKGRTIRFPGGRKFSEKNPPSPWRWKKKSSLCLEQNFFEIFRKKILPWEGDENKNSAPVRVRKKNPPLPKLPTPLEI